MLTGALGLRSIDIHGEGQTLRDWCASSILFNRWHREMLDRRVALSIKILLFSVSFGILGKRVLRSN
jgi:hypothetical protein